MFCLIMLVMIWHTAVPCQCYFDAICSIASLCDTVLANLVCVGAVALISPLLQQQLGINDET